MHLRLTVMASGFHVTDAAGNEHVFASLAPLARHLKTLRAAHVKVTGEEWYTVRLDDCGQNKIGTIKIVREWAGLGLADAKAFAESAPVNFPKPLSLVDATRLQDRLKEWGATASFQPVTKG